MSLRPLRPQLPSLPASQPVFPKTAPASHPGRQEWKAKGYQVEQFLVQYEETKNEKV